MNGKVYDTLAELIKGLGQPDHQILIPEDFPHKRHDDVPAEYAIWVNDEFTGGCMIAARYREDDWVSNPFSARPLVWILLRQLKP